MPPVKMRGVSKPKDTKKVFSRLIAYMGTFKFLWILIIFFVFLSSGAEIASSYMVKPILNDYIIPLVGAESPDFVPLIFVLIKTGFLFLFGVLASWGNGRLILYISSNLLCKIRKDLFKSLENLPVKYFEKHPHGELMSRFTSDTDTLRDMFSQTVPQFMTSAVTVLGVFVMMIVLSPLLTFSVLAILASMIFLGIFLGKRSASSFREQQKNIGILNGYIEEMIEGQKVVKVFSQEEKVIEKFKLLNNSLYKSAARANSYGNMLGPVMINLSHVQYALVSVLGAFLVITSIHDIGTIAAFLQYTRNFTRPVTMISQLFNSILNALAGAERIFELIDETEEVDEGRITLVNAAFTEEKLVQAYDYTGNWAWKDNVDNSLRQMKGDVLFENVSFGYRKEKEILHNISIHAYPGQKIALVGSTGSGKTTVINLLARFFDIEEGKGKIFFDGIPIKEISKDGIRHSLGMVLQDTHFFTGTIYDNIKYGNLDAGFEEVKKAAELANADHFINHLKLGYETVLSADGENLSQGQRQLLSIARAAVLNPPILVLDEATSSVDTRTEKMIQSGMDKLMKGRTVFVIAHRLSTVRNADEIIVLDHGSIIERGNHEFLMQKKGRYFELYTGGSNSFDF
ncbi:MAG: ABC transporter ATP-binding protein/permease [Treponema sp.]|nr:ABC transporter ATP-binding protein/permease [Treponema sp.]